ncbi:MAG: hypothetical protein ABFD69_10880 [Candidatus Sumerlaeia bacterium]
MSRRVGRQYVMGYPLVSLITILKKTLQPYLFIALCMLLPWAGVDAQYRILKSSGFNWISAAGLAFAGFFLALFLVALAMLVYSTLKFPFVVLKTKQLPVWIRVVPRREADDWVDPRDPQHHYGEYVALHCRELDELAERLGVTPIYDLSNWRLHITAKWYPSEAGIKTVDAIARYVREQGVARHGEELLKELAAMRNALDRDGEFHIILV